MASPRRYLPLALTLCVGVLVSVVASIMVRGWEHGRIKAEFERQAGILAAAPKSSLDSVRGHLRSGQRQPHMVKQHFEEQHVRYAAV